MELHNMDAEVLDELYKIASINLSPNTPGQVPICKSPHLNAELLQFHKNKTACHTDATLLQSLPGIPRTHGEPSQARGRLLRTVPQREGLSAKQFEETRETHDRRLQRTRRRVLPGN